jgi:hypothetical protein
MVVIVQYFEGLQHRYIIDCFDIVDSGFELVAIGNLAIGENIIVG